MNLHLGCGKRRINLSGWVNVDIDPENEPDVVADCFLPVGNELDEYKGAEVLYACHILEHCGRHEYKAVLKRWYDLLSPGGTLRLAVPDLEAVFDRHLEHSASLQHGSCLTELLGFLYGGQRNEHDYHKMGWDEATLTRDLLAAGFREVRRYDRDKTEHADVDDLSACYLPHIRDCKSMEEYKRGTLMSLNLEAVK